MSKIYWEKQTEGRFCALHCVNSVLQAPMFTKRDLEKLGWDLDRKEKELLGSSEKRFMDTNDLSASENVAGDGFFSVGVLELCLKSKGFTAFQWSKESSRELLLMQGFICHHNDHWFAIRNINSQWWNLDSLLNCPMKITASTLVAKLSGLKYSGYSVLIVSGDYARLPSAKNCVLDPHQYYITEVELADLEKKSRVEKESGSEAGSTASGGGFLEMAKEPTYNLYQGVGNSLGSSVPQTQHDDDIDPDLARALEASRLEAAQGLKKPSPEPHVGGDDVINISVRLGPHGTITRRFAGASSILDVFDWIEFEGAKHPISPPLNVRHGYCVSQMPIRRIEKTFERCVIEHAGVGQVSITDKSLLDVMESSEGFNLQM